MDYIILLLCMLFCHILDDFVLQAACLTTLKQKAWWEKNTTDKKYKHDYLMALLAHCFSWAFMVMLPIFVRVVNSGVAGLNVVLFISISFIANLVIHFIVDDLKANFHRINLITDQCIHIAQIVATFALYICIC